MHFSSQKQLYPLLYFAKFVFECVLKLPPFKYVEIHKNPLEWLLTHFSQGVYSAYKNAANIKFIEPLHFCLFSSLPSINHYYLLTYGFEWLNLESAKCAFLFSHRGQHFDRLT